MLDSIRDFFERFIGARPVDNAHSGDAIALATTALLVEAMRADARIDDRERAVVLAAVSSRFGIDGSRATELLALAEREVREANDHYQFTSLIDRHFDQPAKIRVLETMWQVIWADGRIDAHERHLMRRITDLLHVTHGDAVAAQARAREAALGPRATD
ncbi:MAG: TerB family tellurite resistance protein [Burkholderiaceae bacterium]|nr:TerB family tellurite resistance protein [Burkholderiaceae bacterium]